MSATSGTAPALELDLRARVGALDLEVALTLGPGPFVLAGPSGAGKTSVLALLLGILPASAGRIAASGRVLYDAGAGIDLSPEERGLGYVPQQYALFPHRSVLGNVGFGLACQRPRPPAAQIEARARALLLELEIGHLERRAPATLSAGERQRVAIARALAPEPRALLLDEPLAALDAGLRGRVRKVLAARLAALSLPALVVTHDPADAAALGTRIAILEQGRIAQQGTLAELVARPATAFAAEFAAGVEAALRRPPSGPGSPPPP